MMKTKVAPFYLGHVVDQCHKGTSDPFELKYWKNIFLQNMTSRIYPIEWGNFIKAAEFTPLHGCS